MWVDGVGGGWVLHVPLRHRGARCERCRERIDFALPVPLRSSLLRLRLAVSLAKQPMAAAPKHPQKPPSGQPPCFKAPPANLIPWLSRSSPVPPPAMAAAACVDEDKDDEVLGTRKKAWQSIARPSGAHRLVEFWSAGPYFKHGRP